MSTPTPPYKLIGIDPGTNILGYAIIEVRKKKLYLIEHGLVKLSHLSSHQLKLKKIFERIQELIEIHKPKEMAVEAPFFGKNVQSMLKLGRAQGVTIAAAMTKNVDVSEYAPKRIKQSVTGNGNASKEQVAAMVEKILNTKIKQSTFDSTDAIAVAICHYYQSTSVLGKITQKGGWKGFIKDNPDRIK